MSPEIEEPQIHESAEQARQGGLGYPVWVVLVVSTALAAVIFAVIWFTFAGSAGAVSLLGLR